MINYQIETTSPGIYLPIEADDAQQVRERAEAACKAKGLKPKALWLRTAVLFGELPEATPNLPYSCSTSSSSPSQPS